MKKSNILYVFCFLLVAVLFQNCGGFTANQLHLSSDQLTDPPGNRFGIPVLAPLNFPSTLGSSSAPTFKRAFASLTFQYPIYITSARDGSNRLFVIERAGRIKVFKNSDTVTTSKTFLDIASSVSTDGEQGLLGMAFAPDFKTSGYFYVYYFPSSGPRRSRFSRFKVSAADRNIADPSSEKIILEVVQPSRYNFHKGGTIQTGPDGNLYIALGDGGGHGDPNRTAQDTKQLLGKVIRINPRVGDPYSIPNDNPFYVSGGALCNTAVGSTNCPEIYAYGVRNPFRWSFDRNTGKMWLADVGEKNWEEINIVKKGDNLGWSAWEGKHEFGNYPTPPEQAPPIFEYDHTVGRSITGGYVYRGKDLSDLVGRYIYGDYVVGKIWALNYDGTRVLSNQEIGSVPNLASFGEDEAGEIYAVNLVDGQIFKMVKSGEGPDTAARLPAKLSQTGLFQDLGTLTPVSGLTEYDVNAPLWSDGAEKRRWIAVPNGAKIDFSDRGPWNFPNQTVLVKHFEMRLSSGDLKRLETRVLILMTEGWKGFTYKWNGTGTDADLILEGANETLTVRDSSGTEKSVTWRYPSANQCMQCHTGVSGFIQGVSTAQLNKNFKYSVGTENQLVAWQAMGYLKTPIPPVASLPAYADLKDRSQPLEQRARSYLASNCSMCHQPSGPTTVDMDLRYQSSLVATKTVGVESTSGDLGLTDPKRILPGSKERSVLWERLRRNDDERMPPLGTSITDPNAVEVIGEWIDQLAP